ncbi:putative aldouronate transport system permease protein [Paenibacillus cellulosilyticus]|uniref:Putative aldouronate transport system permease protein n=1 Tax=Paenibacillus cellulosilyticus TaxID=375489 RepID=A0A2V2YQ21_9BACL|nr:ABC transporter permease subunit [Paenibacillus cellulosilyticus]PWV94541.1 putative aldouronate transport system permease protein [Paenibacillus cellulosilyticus]QKS45045.1 sugar ABC transporter permease [Paenibacillus cellulosilyticus]
MRAIHYLQRYWQLYIMLLPVIAYFFVFKYMPLYGVTIAFKEYNPFKGVNASEWIGLDVFRNIFAMEDFYTALRNTFLLNGLDFVFGFPAPIFLAICLNELKFASFKRLSQTLLYLPHFISWVIIGGIMYQLFATNYGIINLLLAKIGIAKIPFLSDSSYWLVTYTSVGIWQSIGWGSIIYLAAMTGINKELYDAADVDGASRLRRIWHITIPGIRSTIIVLMILKIGDMVDIGFDRPYIIGNVMVRDVSDVLSTFIYRVGLQNSQYSTATAVGLFQAVVGLAFVLTANYVSKKTTDESII